MKIIVALDSFKDCMKAEQACQLVAEEIRRLIPQAQVIQRPMADGGEGTARTAMNALGGQWIQRTVMGPLPEMTVDAGFAWFEQEKTVLVEMASASGLERLASSRRNPLLTTTYGTGQLIQAALDLNPEKILLAVGGSATVDGGAGAAAALGWQLLDEHANPIPLGGGNLGKLSMIHPPKDIKLPPIEVLCDVDNFLCGENGAAAVYGPQKGATTEMVKQLEQGLFHFAGIVRKDLCRDILDLPGAGAAGGLSAGAVAFMNATLVSGVDTIIDHYKLVDELADADLIITGEGCFDRQSLCGKVISGIVKAAEKTPAKIAVLAGQVTIPSDSYRSFGIDAAFACKTEGMESDYAINHCPMLLEERTRECIDCLL